MKRKVKAMSNALYVYAFCDSDTEENKALATICNEAQIIEALNCEQKDFDDIVKAERDAGVSDDDIREQYTNNHADDELCNETFELMCKAFVNREINSLYFVLTDNMSGFTRECHFVRLFV